MLVDPVFGLHSLGTVARALSVSMPLEPLLEIAAEEAVAALGAASVSIGRLEPGGRSQRTLINVGDLAPTEVRWPVDEYYPLTEGGVLAQVLTDGTARTSSLRDDDCHPTEAELLRALGKGSSVAAAIVVDGSVWGEFYATQHVAKDCFARNAVDYVDVFTAILGAAISRSLRESELAHLAFHDALTGALNRRGLEQAVAPALAPAAGTPRAVTVVALDIDGLKRVNDHDGHARGDDLITTVAAAMHEAFAPYPGSLVARVGGDEFIVVVVDHEPAEVVRTVDALCGRMARGGGGFGPGVGLSAGVAATLLTGRDDVSRDDLVAAADRALYVAKQRSPSAFVVSDELVCETGAALEARPDPTRRPVGVQ